METVPCVLVHNGDRTVARQGLVGPCAFFLYSSKEKHTIFFLYKAFRFVKREEEQERRKEEKKVRTIYPAFFNNFRNMNKNMALYMGLGAMVLIALTIAPMTDLDGFSFGKSSLEGSPYEGFEGLQQAYERRVEAMQTKDAKKKEAMSNNDDDGGEDEDESSDKKKSSKKDASAKDEEENFELLTSPGSFSVYGNKSLDNGLSLIGFPGVYYPAGHEQKLSVGFEGEKECAKKFGLNGGAAGVQMTAEQCQLMMSRGGNI